MALDPDDRSAIVDAIREGFRSGGGSGGGSGGNQQAGLASEALSRIGTAGVKSASDLLKFGSTVFGSGARVSDAIGTVGSVMTNVGGVFGSTMGDLTKQLTGATLEVVKAAESGVDTYRKLSQSGASFNNNILLMKNSAAQARLTLDEYASVVQQNAQGFAAFGGTVTSGARLFSDASKRMFDEGLATPLLNMGMTFNDINEDLAEFMVRNRRRFTEEEIRNGTAAASMTLMATEMDKIAKLTGQNRKEMEKEIQDRLRKGQVEAKIRMLEMSGNTEAAEKMRLALAEASKAGPGALAAVEDLFTKGAVVSEEGRNAAVALGPAFGNLQSMVAAASGPGGIESMRSSIDSFNGAVAARINDPNFLQAATLGGMGNGVTDAFAGLVSSAGTYADNVQALMDRENISREEAIRRLDEQARTEQGARDGVTSTVINGEKALRDLGAVINDKLLGEGGAFTRLSNELLPFADSLERLNRADIESAVTRLQEGFENVAQTATVALGGDMEVPEPTVRPEDISVSQQTQADMRQMLSAMQDMEGLQRTDAHALAAALGTSVGPALAEVIRAEAERNNRSVEDQLREIVTGGPTDEIVTMAKQMFREQNPNASELQADQFANSLLQASNLDLGALIEGSNIVVSEMNVTASNLNNPDIARAAGGPVEAGKTYVVGEKGPEWFRAAADGFITPNREISRITSNLQGAMQNMAPQMRNMAQSIDTSGLESIMSNFAQQAQTMFNNPATQDSFKEVAEMLNTNLQEQTGLLAQQAKTATRQLRSIGGLAGDMFKGFG